MFANLKKVTIVLAGNNILVTQDPAIMESALVQTRALKALSLAVALAL